MCEAGEVASGKWPHRLIEALRGFEVRYSRRPTCGLLAVCRLEGVAILSAVVVVVMVASINDYQKEKQFRDLNAKKEDVEITVVRAVSG